MNPLLFIVHPTFAVDCWGYENNLHRLRAFYVKVIRAIRRHKGPVIVTMMTPYAIRQRTNLTSDKANRKEYHRFLEALAMTKAHLYWDDEHQDIDTKRPLGTPTFPHIEDMLLNEEISGFVFGGGYFTSCLKATWDNFQKIFRTFCMDNAIDVKCDPTLVLDAGYPSYTLDEKGVAPNDTYMSW